MLVIGLGEHDIILGRKWAADINVLIDCRKACVYWPKQLPRTNAWNRIIVTTKRNLLSVSAQKAKKHQEDVDRMERLMLLDI
jgi:hypothetical protein